MTAAAKLGQQTGGTPEQQTAEAIRRLKYISEHKEFSALTPLLRPEDQTFFRDMMGKYKMYGQRMIVTGRQIFWLRDMCDKLDGTWEPRSMREDD